MSIMSSPGGGLPLLLGSAAFAFTLLALLFERGLRSRHRLAERAQQAARPNTVADGEQAPRMSLQPGRGLQALAALMLPVVPARDRAKTRTMLDGAGFRAPEALSRYFGLKALAFGLGGLLVAGLFFTRGAPVSHPVLQALLVFFGAFAANMTPEFVLRSLRSTRRRRIHGSLADAIDLMIITANAGQSLDVAMTRVGREIERLAPELADELQVTVSELQVLPSRSIALRNLADRTGLPEMRSLTAALIQTIRYGTPLSQALRVLAMELRQARVLALEEKAAKLPALLSLPLMLLIMPAVFIVTAGPAVLGLIQAFNQ